MPPKKVVKIEPNIIIESDSDDEPQPTPIKKNTKKKLIIKEEETVLNNQTNKHIDSYVMPYMTNMLSSMQDLYEQNLLSPEDKKAIFGNNMTIKQFNEAYQADPHSFIKKMGALKLRQVTSAFHKYLGEESNVGHSTVLSIFSSIRNGKLRKL